MNKRKPLVIGICGYARVGKTTTAEAICEQTEGDALILPFASSVKYIARNFFNWDGQKDDRGRKLLQVLGTDAGRMYDQNLWVQRWEEELIRVAPYFSLVIADDVRFQNEIQAIAKAGGFVARLDCKERAIIMDHASEDVDSLTPHFRISVSKNITPQEIAEKILGYAGRTIGVPETIILD
jgi:hypothetical protein